MHGEKVTSGCYLQLCFCAISACVIAVAFSLKNYRITIVLGCSFLICCQLLAVQRGNYKCTANSPACTAFLPSGHSHPTNTNKILQKNEPFL